MGGGAHNTHTQLLARGPGAGSQPGGERTERNTKTGTTQGGQAGEGALMEAAMAGGQQGSPSLLSLTQQILLVVHQGFATCGCSSFDPDLGVLGTGLINKPAQG